MSFRIDDFLKDKSPFYKKLLKFAANDFTNFVISRVIDYIRYLFLNIANVLVRKIAKNLKSAIYKSKSSRLDRKFDNYCNKNNILKDLVDLEKTIKDSYDKLYEYGKENNIADQHLMELFSILDLFYEQVTDLKKGVILYCKRNKVEVIDWSKKDDIQINLLLNKVKSILNLAKDLSA